MSIFRLKQFAIKQEQSALKVGTDSTILGAYAANSDIHNVQRILDVGTGTGIIALMVAQTYQTALIDAIEIDTLSSEEATENFEQSRWSNRLTLFNEDYSQFNPSHRYELIISNPPYFTETHYNSCDRETVAKHMQSLPPEVFFNQSKKLLNTTDNSRIITITASSAIERFRKAANKASLFAEKEIYIHPQKGANTHRIISVWQHNEVETMVEHIDILDGKGRHDYSPEVSRLLSPYLIILPDI